jgi:hypothetical protein
MDLIPTRETVSCAVTQKLPSILMNPKIHFCVHKRLPLVPILSQINPVHTTSSHFSKIHFNIVHPPTSWSSQRFPSFQLSQYLICIPLLHIRAICPVHLIFLDLISLIILGEEYKL